MNHPHDKPLEVEVSPSLPAILPERQENSGDPSIAALRSLPYLSCSYRKSFMLIRVLASMEDTVTISHSSAGCDADWIAADQHYRSMLRTLGHPLKHANLISTNLTEREMIFGGDEKLQHTVAAAVEQYHPRAVFIRTKCCMPGRSASEMAELINRIQRQYSIPILLARCDSISGIPSRRHPVSQRKVLPSWKALTAPAVKTDKPYFNLVNFTDDESFHRLLETSGVPWNYLSYCSPFKAYRQSSGAAATIQYSPAAFGSSIGAMLDRHTAVPFFQIPPPYGIAGAEHAFESLGNITGAHSVFRHILAEQQERSMPELEELRRNLHGLRCLPIFADRPVYEQYILPILHDLHLSVIGENTHSDYYSAISEHTTVPSFYGEEGLQFGSYGGYKLLNFLQHQNPDILLTYHNGLAAWSFRMGIPTIEFKEFHAGLDLFGYDGLLRLGRMIFHTITHARHIRHLAAHTSFPYRPKWLKHKLVWEA